MENGFELLPPDAQRIRVAQYMDKENALPRTRTACAVAGILWTGLWAAFACPQAPAIRVAANMVLTPVSVTDGAGRAIRDLKLGDFEIEENAIRVSPELLGGPGEAPVELALLLDMSGSVYSLFELERQAAARFLSRIMRPCDSVFIMSIANEPKLLQERTSSLQSALRAVAAVSPTTQATAFFNSIETAARLLREEERPDARRAIVTLSDGEDNRSVGNRIDDALRQLQQTNCLFYSINPKGTSYAKSLFGRRAQEAMEQLARQTGGASFVVDKVEDLSGFYDRIADELQTQYLLGYYSPAKTGSGIYRRISIKVRGRPDLQVKARSGYYPK